MYVECWSSVLAAPTKQSHKKLHVVKDSKKGIQDVQLGLD